CLDYLADVLVPHRPPGRGDIHAAVVGVDIGAAYPGRCHLEDDVVRLLDLRVGDVLDNDFERALERGGFHGGDLLESYCRVLSAGAPGCGAARSGHGRDDSRRSGVKRGLEFTEDLVHRRDYRNAEVQRRKMSSLLALSQQCGATIRGEPIS